MNVVLETKKNILHVSIVSFPRPVYTIIIEFMKFSDGKCLACTFRAKFIEVSVGINHNVDELLAGTLTQIRLKKEHNILQVWKSIFQCFFYSNNTLEGRRDYILYLSSSFCWICTYSLHIPVVLYKKNLQMVKD